MKRVWTIGTVILLLGVLLAGCGGGKEAGEKSSAESSPMGSAPAQTTPAKDVTVKIYTSKIELLDQFNQMKADYEKEHPGVKLQIDATMGGDDYDTQLKAKFATQEMPDIFNNTGYNQLEVWLEHLEDLSDQPWVQDEIEVAKEPMLKDGKIYGMPINLEGLGLIYNKEHFEKAGIAEVPKTLSELKAAVEKLKAAGIQPFITNYDSWFGLGYHMINNPFAKQKDPNAFMQSLNEGTASIATDPLFQDWVQLFDLFVQNGSPKPLTLDIMTAITELSTGKGAMMLAGNFFEPSLKQMNSTAKLGLMPIPINDDVALNDNLFVGPPTNWVIYKDSPVKEEAKEFLNWLVTSDTGRHYLTDKFEFIPAFKSVKAEKSAMGTMSQDVVSYVEQGKVLGWYFSRFPDGVAQEFGASMQKYVAHKIDAKQMLDELQAAWESKRPK